MALLPRDVFRTLDDVRRFEAEMPLAQRLDGPSIYDTIAATASRMPDANAFTMVMTGADDEVPRHMTYAQFLALLRQTANLFSSLGGKSPGVAYMLPSLVETHATLWGAETVGYAVPVNFLLQPDHIAHLIRASGAKILVALGPHPQLDIWQKALKLREEMPELILVAVSPPDSPAIDGAVDFASATATQPSDHLIFGEARKGDDVAAYFHTGGTTGAPRLVAHTHNSQLAAALGGAALCNMQPGDVRMANLPLFHVGGTIVGALSCFMSGGSMLIMSPSGMRNPAMVNRFWHLIERYKVASVGSVPTALGAALEVPVNGADLSSIRAGTTGAASLPVATSDKFLAVTGKDLHEIYGMTEASGLIAIDPPAGAQGKGSVGFPLPYTRTTPRKLNADGSIGEACAQGEIGVLILEGPNISPGYRDPAHDAGVFLEGGALNSGDLGYVDTTGRIHIAGRSKDLIIRSGHNIDPLMIENVMQKHPAVALAAAVGMPDAYAGELPVCYVALRPGSTVTEDELQDYAQTNIAERPAWPRHIWFVDTIPLTTVGKIFKPQLRCDATERLVKQIVQKELGMADARVEAKDGGKRGMSVAVELPLSSAEKVPAIERALNGFLFEAKVAAAQS